MASKATQASLLKQLRSLTNASASDATRLLKASNWRIEAAVDAFYSDAAAMNNAASASSSSKSSAGAAGAKKDKEVRDKLGAIFDRFADQEVAGGQEMNIEGTMEYCDALGLSPEDVVLLPLCFYLGSPTMGKFTKTSFVDGWRVLATGHASECDTLKGMKARLPALKDELQRDEAVKGPLATAPGAGTGGLFKRVYEYTYTFARPEGQKSLPLESALAFWDLLIPHAPTFQTQGGSFSPKQLELWKQYLQEQTAGKAVSKDTWSLFLDFTKDIDPDFTTHDFEAAWPSIIDGFAIWARQKLESGAGGRATATTNASKMDES